MYLNQQIRLTVAVAVAMFAVMVAGAFAGDYFVDGNVATSGSGVSWTAALKTIQEGINACSATSADTVHVAAATYVENIDLADKNRVEILGGYPAGGGTRNHAANRTTINGGSVATVVRVYRADYVTIDGFTITNGYARPGGAETRRGGGIYCIDCEHLQISFCDVCGNKAYEDGGGLYLTACPTVLINNCTFCSNSTEDGNGGGIYLDSCTPDIEILDTCIMDNEAHDGSEKGCGGGITCENYSSPVMRNCTIGNNLAEDGGGFFCENHSSPDLINCLITENKASGGDRNPPKGFGGGVYAENNSSPTLTNCTVSNNVAENDETKEEYQATGGGLFCLTGSCEPVIINSIFWDNEPDEITGSGIVTITYSDIMGGAYGTPGSCTPDGDGNLDCNPLFRSRGGSTNYDGYFLDQDASPCIDTGLTSVNPYGGSGNPKYSTDVNGYLDMTADCCVDMGYHYPYYGCTYIKLVSFDARPDGTRILLTWETGAEVDNAGFAIYRAVSGTQDYHLVSNMIAAKGSPTSGASYAFSDGDVKPSVAYKYWLVDIDVHGGWRPHGPVSAALPIDLSCTELRTVWDLTDYSELIDRRASR